MLCYLADISSMCRLASWQAETTGALGMLSVQEISFILINAAPNPPLLLLQRRSTATIFCLYVLGSASLFVRFSSVCILLPMQNGES